MTTYKIAVSLALCATIGYAFAEEYMKTKRTYSFFFYETKVMCLSQFRIQNSFENFQPNVYKLKVSLWSKIDFPKSEYRCVPDLYVY